MWRLFHIHGSPKCLPPILSNLRWFRIRPWGSRVRDRLPWKGRGVAPLPVHIRLLSKALNLLWVRRLGRRPYMPQLPLCRPHGSATFQLSHTSYGTGTGGYVGSTPPGRTVPGDHLAIRRPPSTPGRRPFLSFLTSIPGGVPSPHLESPAGPLHLSSHISFHHLWCPEDRQFATQQQQHGQSAAVPSLVFNVYFSIDTIAN